MFQGSCLCGAVKYEFDAAPEYTGHCHCAMCRKAHGAAFGTYAIIPKESFRFTGGLDSIAEYCSSPGIVRTFCRHCGSTLQFIREDRGDLGVTVGTIDSGPELELNFQVWTSVRADWGRIDDDLPSYETDLW
ncbi:MAG: GFA family protein [Gammaproteobacteria bacterium]